MTLRIAKASILKDLEYFGCLSIKNLGICETYRYLAITELLSDGLIIVIDQFVYITEDGLAIS